MKRLMVFSLLVVGSVNGALNYSFGSMSIERKTFDFIVENMPEGGTLLELGSGWATSQLIKHFNVCSIEHDSAWVNKYHENYIHAPIVDGWYSVEVLKEQLPEKYDMILVDGPPGHIGRYGFVENLELFNTDVIIVVDDIHRAADYKVLQDTAKLLDREFEVVSIAGGKKFGIIRPVSN